MKKSKILAFLMIIAVVLFGGFTVANAVASLPQSVVSDAEREVEYIKNFPVIVKATNHGQYYVYCMNLTATYGGGITFTKTGEVDPGYTYILNNRPQTSNKDKDFYITQMAVWYYEDYLNQNNVNLVSEVKKYIIAHKDTEEVSNKIYALYNGAKNYKATVGKITIDKTKPVTFTKEGDYFVSSEINVRMENINKDVKYSLSKAPAGAQIIKTDAGTLKVKVPVAKITPGYQITLGLNVEGTYTKYTGYYYFYNSSYQRVLFQDALSQNIAVSDSIQMTVQNRIDKFDVNISKTDVTQAKEVEGATLVLKDEDGDVIESWVSTKNTHKVTLTSGKYSLTETIAPKGYRLSTSTIEFMIDLKGNITVKDEQGKYVPVNRVVMINELIDVVSFAKKDAETNEFVSGAKLAIKDEKGKLIHEFISTKEVHSIELDPGHYTLSEVSAPEGYILSKEVIYFELLENGTLKVKNNKGDYTDSAIITFYNSKKKEEDKVVVVPATGKNSTLLIVGGIALLIGGVACAKKTIKEC